MTIIVKYIDEIQRNADAADVANKRGSFLHSAFLIISNSAFNFRVIPGSLTKEGVDQVCENDELETKAHVMNAEF